MIYQNQHLQDEIYILKTYQKIQIVMKICNEMYRKIKILKNHKQETLKKQKTSLQRFVGQFNAPSSKLDRVEGGKYQTNTREIRTPPTQK